MKDKYAAAALGFFLGGLGLHKFYLGQGNKGIWYLIFCWTSIPSLIGFVDGISYLCMSNKEFKKKYK